MSNNPNFPDAGSLLAELEERCAAMQQANLDCFNGGHAHTARRKLCRSALDLALDKVLLHVRAQCRGDVAVALSSGFQLRKPPILLPPLGPVENLRWVRSMSSGRVELRWDPQHGARNYIVYTNPDGPQNDEAWRKVGAPGKAKLVLYGLEPGQSVWFKVMGISASGSGGMSQVVLAIPY
ncbi:MAG: fibronectin type III domain-containing protein [Flavobacteriales bacterium]